VSARIIIVGAGFGGLEAARALAGSDADITILDRHNHHCFQPLLYQVATAALSPGDVAWPIRGILRGQKNVRVLMGTVVGIDVAQRIVRTASMDLPYDYLVLATGATHSYFGHDEWSDVAPGLKRIEDATILRRRLLIAFERAEACTDAAEHDRLLTFVVIGGGPTGVEMAGAISDLAKMTLAGEFRTIDPAKTRVVLVEAGPHLLSAFPGDLSDYARRSLEKMGVEVLTNVMVTQCDTRGCDTTAGRIDSATLMWAAGVVASPAARWIGAAADRTGRILVRPDLTIEDHPEIFAIGDTASVRDTGGRPVPGVAPAAKQMGHYVGQVIAARLRGQKTERPFVYRHQGDLATIGRKIAIVRLGRLKLTGFIGWLFWSLVHIYFLIGARNRLAVAFKWVWDYATFQRGVRLITIAPVVSGAPDEKDS